LASSFTIEETARRIRNYQWLEMRLFEVLGGWIQTIPELEVKVMLARHCYHHAWHAQLWHTVLPGLPQGGPGSLTVPANEHLEALVRALGDHQGPDSTTEKLVGVYRVLLPMAIAAYQVHLSRASDVADGPAKRCLGIVLADERADVGEGEALLGSLIDTEAKGRRASDHQGALEAILASAEGAG